MRQDSKVNRHQGMNLGSTQIKEEIEDGTGFGDLQV